MLRISTLSLLAALSTGLATTADATVIFEANDTNVALFNNSGTISGSASAVSGDSATGDLDLTVTGPNFSNAGFASTDSINDILGVGNELDDNDVVTVTFTTGVLDQNGDGGQLRSRGIELGLAASPTEAGGESDDQLLIRATGGGNGGPIVLVGSANAGPATGGGAVSNAEANDGLTVTIVADVDGWVATFTDAGAITDFTGSFDPGEFANIVGNGHLYAAFQQRFGGANGVTVPFEVASIDVTAVPEPGSLALLGLGGLLIARRRRG